MCACVYVCVCVGQIGRNGESGRMVRSMEFQYEIHLFRCTFCWHTNCIIFVGLINYVRTSQL